MMNNVKLLLRNLKINQNKLFFSNTVKRFTDQSKKEVIIEIFKGSRLKKQVYTAIIKII